MTIEITRAKSIYQYRIKIDDHTVIEWRPNTSGPRPKYKKWKPLGVPFSTAELARVALLSLEKDEEVQP